MWNPDSLRDLLQYATWLELAFSAAFLLVGLALIEASFRVETWNSAQMIVLIVFLIICAYVPLNTFYQASYRKSLEMQDEFDDE